MILYSIESRTRKYATRYAFLPFGRNLSSKYRRQSSDTGLDALKTATKKVAHKAAEATWEFIGNKMAYKTMMSKSLLDEN